MGVEEMGMQTRYREPAFRLGMRAGMCMGTVEKSKRYQHAIR